jgi:hypothetical protein
MLAAMTAEQTQHSLFARLSSAVQADRKQVSVKIKFVLWFINRQADNIIPAQQQAVNVNGQSISTLLNPTE